jgi:AcrR family transcriptional regulator
VESEASSGRVRLTQEQRRTRTRAAVLDAAAKSFALSGFHGTSVDDIAEAAGVSKGAIYYSFPSKDDLFVALLEQRTQAWVTAMNSAPADSSLNGQASHAVSGFFADLDADPSWTPLLLEFLAYSARDERTRAMMNERFFGALQAAVEAATAERTAAAGLRDVPIAEFAAGVTALACGLGIERSFGPAHRVDEVMTTMLDLLLEGLLARAARAQP